MTTCETITPLLDEFIDGTLSLDQQAEVQRHLAGCPDCCSEVVALRDLLGLARVLPRSVPPERNLWDGIAPRLSPVRSRVRGPLQLRALRIAAAFGLLLTGAGLASLWYYRISPHDFATHARRYDAASTTLAEALARDAGTLPPATRAVVERNLAIVDAAIREAENALRTDPGNAALEQMLVVRYEQRLALLRRAGATGRES
jgi:anti-sigma factor RsiW